MTRRTRPTVGETSEVAVGTEAPVSGGYATRMTARGEGETVTSTRRVTVVR